MLSQFTPLLILVCNLGEVSPWNFEIFLFHFTYFFRPRRLWNIANNKTKLSADDAEITSHKVQHTFYQIPETDGLIWNSRLKRSCDDIFTWNGNFYDKKWWKYLFEPDSRDDSTKDGNSLSSQVRKFMNQEWLLRKRSAEKLCRKVFIYFFYWLWFLLWLRFFHWIFSLEMKTQGLKFCKVDEVATKKYYFRRNFNII